MTATGGLHERLVDIAVSLDEIVARHRNTSHRMKPVRSICAGKTALLQIIENLRDHELGLADAHGVTVSQRFLGHEAWMHATHDDGNAASAKFISDLIASIDVGGHG